jgi:hypothetical protein
MLVPSQFSTVTTPTASTVAVTALNPLTLATNTLANIAPAESTLALNMVGPVAPWVQACSNTAPLASVVLLSAPMLTIKDIVANKSVGNLPLLPYSSMIANW